MSNNIQLDKFAEALFEHPFRDGVFRPSRARYGRTPSEFLKEFAEHYEDCDSSLCMGYHTAFLISYFSHLSQTALSELVASLKLLNIDPFLQRARFFIEREARNGCVPEAVFVEELKEADVIVRDLMGPGERVRRGKTLAKDTRASKVYIRGFLSTGETFVIPGIAPEPNSNYLPVKSAGESLA